MKLLKIMAIVIWSLLLLTLLSCYSNNQEINTPTPRVAFDIGDGGLISRQPCAPPCFFGIHVGETSFDQAIPILETNNIHPCNQEGINIFCKNNSNTANVIMAANKST